jgi:hypothetical protein
VVSIQLDPMHQKSLDELAKRQGEDATDLARRIVPDEKHTILLASGYNTPKTEPRPDHSHLCDFRQICCSAASTCDTI